MGYTTDFEGEFQITPKLRDEDKNFLIKFSNTRRVARLVDPKYGVEGEFFVDGSAGDLGMGQGHDANITDYNRPPSTQPSLWCDWTPNQEGTSLIWNGGEKFYHYIEWTQYLIDTILKPRGYVLNGEVTWQGEDPEDRGVLVIDNNLVMPMYSAPNTIL